MADILPIATEALAASDAPRPPPKKPVSSYWFFTARVRDEITQELKQMNGGKASFGEVAKATSSRWAALSDEERKEFDDMAAEDRQRYADELKDHLEASDPASILRNKHAHLIPQKPRVSAYLIFSQDPTQREIAAQALKDAGIEDGTQKQIVTKLSEMWKSMSPEEKAPFDEKHEQELAEHAILQEQWQASPEYAEIEAAAKKQAEQRKAECLEVKESPKLLAKRSRPSFDAPLPRPEAEKPARRSFPLSEASAPKVEADKVVATRRSSLGLLPPPDAPAHKTEADRAIMRQSPLISAKRPRLSSTASEEPTVIDLEGPAEEPNRTGLEEPLRKLSSHLAACSRLTQDLLKALEDASGLVDSAKHSLLGP